jgi:hypothetical protein
LPDALAYMTARYIRGDSVPAVVGAVSSARATDLDAQRDFRIVAAASLSLTAARRRIQKPLRSNPRMPAARQKHGCDPSTASRPRRFPDARRSRRSHARGGIRPAQVRRVGAARHPEPKRPAFQRRCESAGNPNRLASPCIAMGVVRSGRGI